MHFAMGLKIGVPSGGIFFRPKPFKYSFQGSTWQNNFFFNLDIGNLPVSLALPYILRFYCQNEINFQTKGFA